MYTLKEIFYTIQGEGMHTGRPAVFLRFAGCNLWTGHEKHRMSAICKFCDTDFVGTDGENGGKYETEDLIQVITSLWPADTGCKPFLAVSYTHLDVYKRQVWYRRNGSYSSNH